MTQVCIEMKFQTLVKGGQLSRKFIIMPLQKIFNNAFCKVFTHHEHIFLVQVT